ncbi:MAG: PQQ-binding-like beta-propeller repeat protein [Methanomassiliicoccales archaeon]
MSFILIAAAPVSVAAEGTSCAVLLDFGNGEIAWADIPSNNTLNAFNMTQMAAQKLGLDFQFDHYSWGNFITKIGDMDTPITFAESWSLWTWNTTTSQWDSSMVGPDSITASDVTAIAYSFGGYPSPAPLATPEHRYPWASFRHDNLNTGNQPVYMPNNLTLAWKVDLANGAIDAPIVAWQGYIAIITGGVLNMTDYSYDTNSSVYVLNQTGGIVWHEDIGTGYQVGAPLVYDGMLIVPAANGKVYAFNAFTGASLWTYDTGSGLTHGVTSSPIASQGKIIVGTGNGNFISLNKNGTKAWNVTIATGIYSSSPAAFNGTFYIGTDDGKLNAIAADGSGVVWALQTGSKIRGSPLLLKDEIVVTYLNYTGTSPTSGGIAGVSYTGQLLWQRSTDVIPGSPVLTKAGIAVVTYTGIVMVETNGTLLWNKSLGTGFAGAAPASVGGSIYLVTNEAASRLIALSNAGEIYFQQVLLPAQYALSAPAIADGLMFVSSDNGNVYAYHLNSVSPSNNSYSFTENGLTVSFEAKVANGTLIHYSWNFGDGNTSTGAAVNHTYASAGSYTVLLTATTPNGQSENYTMTAVATSTITTGSSPSNDNAILIILVVAIVLIAIIVGVFMMRRRK